MCKCDFCGHGCDDKMCTGCDETDCVVVNFSSSKEHISFTVCEDCESEFDGFFRNTMFVGSTGGRTFMINTDQVSFLNMP